MTSQTVQLLSPDQILYLTDPSKTGISLVLYLVEYIYIYMSHFSYVQNAVSAQPCVGKFLISLVLLNVLHCNFRLWF